MRASRPYLALLVLTAVVVSTPAVRAQSSSASYTLKQSTTNSAGRPSNSASYALGASAAQETAIGTSSSPHYVLQSGFWSFTGSGLVPVILMVERNGGDPTHIDLDWSGNNPPYDIYQSIDCTSVFASFFNSTGANGYADITPPATSLVCYNVLATAPGPVPPPENFPGRLMP